MGAVQVGLSERREAPCTCDQLPPSNVSLSSGMHKTALDKSGIRNMAL